MSADNRPVTTDALETLGTIIGTSEARDAIHLAVEPITAGQDLAPGEHIGIGADGKAYRDAQPLLGIVDPFLAAPAKGGERFWLVVYPRQITSLRHVWTHPAFPAVEVPVAPAIGSKEASEKWMRAWAVEHMRDTWDRENDPVSQDEENAAYEMAIEAGIDHHVGSYEDARDHINEEWWGHWEVITGKKGDREAYFSCSC